ncbi:MAG: TetR/AcrR family transcriptional regulator [Acidimicrobiia bacterium]|nr:TetR/AcrR family transcriptional regulator [Acidimicrobiia bacterium]
MTAGELLQKMPKSQEGARDPLKVQDLALDGRAIGERGSRTRSRILASTATILEAVGINDLRVVDIARSVGCSPATFYQYFRDSSDAVLALAEQVGEETIPLGAEMRVDWRGPGGVAAARRMVDGFVSYWDAHRAVLRTRNLAAQEGDQRFREVRNRALRPLTEGLALMIRESPGEGSKELTPYAAAAALVAMLERMAEFHTDLEDYGVSREDVVRTTALIIHTTVTS